LLLYCDAVPIPARHPLECKMMKLTLGLFETDITAAVAEDLVARLLGDDPPNFDDADFEQLLPVYGEAVVDGLNWELPGGLADEMAEEVRRVVAGSRRPSLYEQLMSRSHWN
jgi:hypothetical protein